MLTNYSGTLPNDILELSAMDEDSIEGRVYLKTPMDVSGKSMHYDAAFKATIRRKVKRSPPTETDMKTAKSTQANVFKAFEGAIQSNNLEKVKKLVRADIAERLSTERGKHMMDRMKQRLPTDTKVLRVTVDGNTAVLETRGVEDGKTVSGIIDLVDEGGSWKLRKITVRNLN